MKLDCRLCGSETERMTPIAHSPTPICEHCLKNILEYHNKKPDKKTHHFCNFVSTGYRPPCYVNKKHTCQFCEHYKKTKL